MINERRRSSRTATWKDLVQPLLATPSNRLKRRVSATSSTSSLAVLTPTEDNAIVIFCLSESWGLDETRNDPSRFLGFFGFGAVILIASSMMPLNLS
jgi:hypothetical protein